MIPIPPKLLLYGALALALAVAIGTIYGCGRKAQSDATALKVARQTIKVERETLKVTSQIDLRVNAEGIQTATNAQEATREIERIREATRIPTDQVQQYGVGPVGKDLGHGHGADSGPGVACDAACARVLQLAREARAAAVASSARLQPAVARAR